MRSFIKELISRSPILFWFGVYTFLMALLCLILLICLNNQLSGVGIWNKPLAFFISYGITAWTLGWILHYQHPSKHKRLYAILFFVSFFASTSIVMIQALRNQASHFNTNGSLNLSMHIALVASDLIFSIVLLLLTANLYKQKKMPISQHYSAGVRLGLLVFLIFTVSGGHMYLINKHTIGANDGGGGIPFLNWSIVNGDLRVAHFFGVHALQIIPLVSYYFLEKKRQVIRFAILYSILILIMYILALMGIPLINLS